MQTARKGTDLDTVRIPVEARGNAVPYINAPSAEVESPCSRGGLAGSSWSTDLFERG
eukprot:SAG22_NODE_3913_length_1469_cov_2.122628_2_plen_57_part_00